MNGAVSAIVPAAGHGRRFGAKTSKIFFRAEGKPLLFYTLKNISNAYAFKEIIVAAHPADFEVIEKMARSLNLKSFRVLRGGATRAESVWRALLEVSSSSEWVLVHDAARPLVDRGVVLRTLETAKKFGGAVAALPATATVKRVDAHGVITGTEDRKGLYLAQTPQVFKRKKLLERYKKLGKKAFRLTDEASFFDQTGTKVGVALGSVSNFKVTTPEDRELFRFYLKHGKRG